MGADKHLGKEVKWHQPELKESGRQDYRTLTQELVTVGDGASRY